MRAKLPVIHNFYEAKALLNGRPKMKIGHNTWLASSNSRSLTVDVIHHKTRIVAFFPLCVYFPNHSWRSRTTKDRLNHFLEPFGLWIEQHNFKWQLRRENFAAVQALDFTVWPEQGVVTTGEPDWYHIPELHWFDLPNIVERSA